MSNSVIIHKKYVKDEKKAREDGVESTLYVTAINGIVREYQFTKKSDPCRNKHLGTLQQFERYWVRRNGFMEC